MIEFHTPELSDKEWVDRIFLNSGERGCDYNFTNIYGWAEAYEMQIAEVDGCIAIRAYGDLGLSYLYPVGENSRKVISLLEEDAEAQGEPFRLVCLSEEHKKDLEAWFPGAFDFREDRDGEDYLYEVGRLAELSGKKLHGKRNHINRFIQDYSEWSTEVLTEENLPECLAMEKIWYQEKTGRDGAETRREDGVALSMCLKHYFEMGLDGLLLRVGDRVVAFTIGERMGKSDTYDVHFEKAFADVDGAYPMINREFARWVRDNYPDVRYLNREDDMGVEGLRQAKKSYYPDLMVEKNIAVLIGELT